MDDSTELARVQAKDNIKEQYEKSACYNETEVKSNPQGTQRKINCTKQCQESPVKTRPSSLRVRRLNRSSVQGDKYGQVTDCTPISTPRRSQSCRYPRRKERMMTDTDSLSGAYTVSSIRSRSSSAPRHCAASRHNLTLPLTPDSTNEVRKLFTVICVGKLELVHVTMFDQVMSTRK